MQSFIVHNREFHQAIVKMSDNAELAELIDRYQLAVFMTLLRQAVGAEQMIRDYIEQHEAIDAAILEGDPDQASDAMRHQERKRGGEGRGVAGRGDSGGGRK